MLVQQGLGGAYVLDYGFAPAVNVYPAPVTHSILVAGYVDHVAVGPGIGDHIVGLLASDYDEPVIGLIQFADGLPQIGPAVRLAGVDGVAQGEPSTRRPTHEPAGEPRNTQRA